MSGPLIRPPLISSCEAVADKFYDGFDSGCYLSRPALHVGRTSLIFDIRYTSG